MAPKRKSKPHAEVSTPRASGAAQDEDAMDIDTPKASETPRTVDTPAAIKQNLPSEAEILGDLWTEDQTSSLFKAIIRWKPSGMHKHFRMIAISEHLRNHGFDPSVETHTRIPGIWRKLAQFFDMDMIDERDNSFDYVKSLGGDEAPDAIYKDFELLPDEFHDLMWARAAADATEQDNWSDSDPDDRKPSRKRRRADADGGGGGSSAAKARRSSTVDDTDQDTAVPSSPVTRSSRRGRSQKRAVARARTEGAESEHEDEEDEDEDDGEDDSSEQDEEEAEVPPARSGRGGRGRGRGRGRVKGGRKKT